MRRRSGARVALRVFVAPALLACVAPVTGQDAGAAAGARVWTAYVGGSVAGAAIPRPFASTCVDEGVGGVGWQAYAGARAASGWDFQVRYGSVVADDLAECAVSPVAEADGVLRVHTFEEGLWGEGLRTVDVVAAYSPPQLSFARVSAGAGWELDASVPFVTVGAGVGVGRGLRFVANAEMVFLRTPYVVLEAEWVNQVLARVTQVADGREWRRGWSLRAGFEVPVWPPWRPALRGERRQ